MAYIEWHSTDNVPAKHAASAFDSGIIVVCGIGLLLSLAAMLFGWFGLPGAVAF